VKVLSAAFTAAERAKLDVFATGLDVTDDAWRRIMAGTEGRAATPADYASTSGIIVVLDGDVWINAPIAKYNASFVDQPAQTLDADDCGLVVRGGHGAMRAQVWMPPLYHDECNAAGEPYTTFAYTHSDRVRVSPIAGCSMRCKFCDLPYKYRYLKKDVDRLADALQRALIDPVQPAGHALLSGGTPRPLDEPYLRDVYAQLLDRFPLVPIDIMMVPLERALDPTWLDGAGVNELSVNIELVNDGLARQLMPHKHRVGLDLYLKYLGRAAAVLGPGRVRSMLMVGVEPIEDTLLGVELIAERGCVPVLSPFRPDSATPMRDLRPPDAAFLGDLFLRARDIAAGFGVPLGPRCIPCTHNTLTFATSGSGAADRQHAHCRLV
jgi:hypothetical protein